jgi:hypothetical protein
MPQYVVIVRDRWQPDSISFVWPGGESLAEAQAARSDIESRLTTPGPSYQLQIEQVREDVPVWERE